MEVGKNCLCVHCCVCPIMVSIRLCYSHCMGWVSGMPQNDGILIKNKKIEKEQNKCRSPEERIFACSVHEAWFEYLHPENLCHLHLLIARITAWVNSTIDILEAHYQVLKELLWFHLVPSKHSFPHFVHLPFQPPGMLCIYMYILLAQILSFLYLKK